MGNLQGRQSRNLQGFFKTLQAFGEDVPPTPSTVANNGRLTTDGTYIYTIKSAGFGKITLYKWNLDGSAVSNVVLDPETTFIGARPLDLAFHSGFVYVFSFQYGSLITSTTRLQGYAIQKINSVSMTYATGIKLYPDARNSFSDLAFNVDEGSIAIDSSGNICICRPRVRQVSPPRNYRWFNTLNVSDVSGGVFDAFDDEWTDFVAVSTDGRSTQTRIHIYDSKVYATNHNPALSDYAVRVYSITGTLNDEIIEIGSPFENVLYGIYVDANGIWSGSDTVTPLTLYDFDGTILDQRTNDSLDCVVTGGDIYYLPTIGTMNSESV